MHTCAYIPHTRAQRENNQRDDDNFRVYEISEQIDLFHDRNRMWGDGGDWSVNHEL